MSFVIPAEPTRSRGPFALLLASTLILCAGQLLDRNAAQVASCQNTTFKADDPGVDPSLAVEFVTWWTAKALDCNERTKVASHLEATKWCTFPAVNYCDATLWADDRLDGPVQGSVAYRPKSLQVVNICPGGLVWVDMRGAWVRNNGYQTALQTNSASTCPMEMIVLVGKDKSGLRIMKSYLINDAQGCEVEAFLHGCEIR